MLLKNLTVFQLKTVYKQSDKTMMKLCCPTLVVFDKVVVQLSLFSIICWKMHMNVRMPSLSGL